MDSTQLAARPLLTACLDAIGLDPSQPTPRRIGAPRILHPVDALEHRLGALDADGDYEAVRRAAVAVGLYPSDGGPLTERQSGLLTERAIALVEKEDADVELSGE